MFDVARSINDRPTMGLAATGWLHFLAAAIILTASYLISTQQWGGLVVLLAACSLMALSSRPFLILAILFAFLPFQSLLTDTFISQTKWVAICKDILAVWTLVVVLLRFLAGRPRRHSEGIAACLAVIASLAAVYVLIAPDLLRASLAFRGVALYPAIAIAVTYCLDGPKELRNLLRVVAIAGALTVVYGVFQHYYDFDQTIRSSWSDLSLRQLRFGTYGLTSTFPGRPDFAGYLVALSLLVWQVRLWKMSLTGILLRVLFLAGTLTCLFWTYSRTNWIALFVGVCVALLLRNKVKAAVGVLVLGMLIGWFYSARISQTSTATQDATTDYGPAVERLKLWEEASQLVLSHPLGYGLGTVGGALITESPSQEKPEQNVMLFIDNAYLKLLLQGGLPLCAAFLVLFALIIRLIVIVPRTLHDPWLKDVAAWASASFVALLAILPAVDYMESTTSIAIYWLAAGILGWLISLSHPRQNLQLLRSMKPGAS